MTNRTALAATTAGALGVVGLAVVIGLLLGAETGSMADWIAAIATVAAFGAAGLAAWHAARAFNLERERDVQSVRSQRTAQAALVAAWPDRFLGNWEQQHDGTSLSIPGIRGAVAMLRNASDIPVTEVHVDFTAVLSFADATASATMKYLGGTDLAVLPPASAPIEIRWVVNEEAVMIPGVPTVGPGDDYPDYGTYDPARLLVTITFRDATGVRWHRDQTGLLSDVLEASPHPD